MFLKSLGVLGGRASLAVAPVRAPASDGRWEFSAHEASPNSTGDGIGWDGMGCGILLKLFIIEISV